MSTQLIICFSKIVLYRIKILSDIVPVFGLLYQQKTALSLLYFYSLILMPRLNIILL